jgi:hypothetical protein
MFYVPPCRSSCKSPTSDAQQLSSPPVLSRSFWTASADRSARVVVSVPAVAVIAVDAVAVTAFALAGKTSGKLSGTAVVPVSAAAAVTVSDIVSISRRMEGGPDGSIGRLGVGVRSALFAAGELAALPVERGGVLALAVFAPKRPENQLVMVLYLLRKSRKSACHGISYGVWVRSTGTSMVC